MADISVNAPREPEVSVPWMRRYPPLATMVVALLIAFLVLPSALNLPQSNPSTVLEFAPVPPEDDTPPPPQSGSLSSLGLGSSSSLSTDSNPPPPPSSGKGGAGEGDRPITKRCVGTPPRQTEDPNSPPCVGYFEGDNGGSTWQGVTGETITAMIYASGGLISTQEESEGGDTSAGERTPSNVYCDLDKPSDAQGVPNAQNGCRDPGSGQELSAIRAMRALARYFNDRYQTYDRHINFWVFFSGCSSNCPPGGRRGDAQGNWEKLKPFGVIDVAQFGGHNNVYADAMARRMVMVFGSFGMLQNSFYRQLAPMVWSFWPDVEHDAEMFASYVCTRVAPYRVSRAGDSKSAGQNYNGKERVYGFVRTSDVKAPGHQAFVRAVRPKLAACGVAPVNENADVTIPETGWTNDNSGDQTYADQNVAKLKGEGVTTVIWMAGMEPKTSRAAARANYFPEWVLMGDRHNDDLINGRAQQQNVWAHAWVMTAQLREDRFADTPARQAYREYDPNGRQIYEMYATWYYRDLFTMVRSIQVAGPHLSPDAVDAGNHAIPRYKSESPFVAACFYDPSDYSCVKDAQEAWWDPDAPDPNGDPTRGCWRMSRKGLRSVAGEWPAEDINFDASRDICNAVKGHATERLV